VFVFTGDEGYLRLPESALRFVAYLAAQDEFIAEEALSWDEDSDWQQVGNVLTETAAEAWSTAGLNDTRVHGQAQLRMRLVMPGTSRDALPCHPSRPCILCAAAETAGVPQPTGGVLDEPERLASPSSVQHLSHLRKNLWQ
jgi:hypothetical protein